MKKINFYLVSLFLLFSIPAISLAQDGRNPPPDIKDEVPDTGPIDDGGPGGSLDKIKIISENEFSGTATNPNVFVIHFKIKKLSTGIYYGTKSDVTISRPSSALGFATTLAIQDVQISSHSQGVSYTVYYSRKENTGGFGNSDENYTTTYHIASFNVDINNSVIMKYF